MGKLHGSLARAGKVKGQTPRVVRGDPKEKTKNTNHRGRALKRLKYNRRVTNNTLGNKPITPF